MRSGASLAAAAAVLTACGGAGAGVAEVVERDSAGGRIVEIPAGATAPGWTVGAEPEGTLGSPQGADLFRVVGALRMPDGRIVVASGGSAEILLHDPRDASVVRFGRKGQGPGEFERIAGLWRAGGDTLLAYDGTLSRVTPFLPDSGFLSPVAIPRGDLDALVNLRGRLASGTYAAALIAAHRGEEPSGVVEVPVTYALLDPAGAPRPFATGRMGQTFVRRTGPRTEYTSIPFSAGSLLAAGPDALHVAGTDRFEIVTHDENGTPVRVLRRDVPARPVSAQDVAAEKARWQENGTDPAEVERRFAEMPLPRQHPVVGRILAARDGTLWVAQTAEPGAPTAWSVFDRDGRMIATLETPPRFRITDVGPGELLGILTDEDDVEQVAWYALDRR